MRDDVDQNTCLAEVLAYLHDRFSTLAAVERPQSELLRGFRAGMTYARVCVLDEITTASIDLSDRTALLDAYSDDVLNPAQRQAFALITERFAALLPDR